MRAQITHLKAPWPLGAVVGDVLDLPGIPVWAVGKCKQVEDDVELTIIAPTIESMCAEILAKGEAPPVATGEGEGAGQPSPGIEPFEEYLGEPAKPKGKHK